MKGVFQQTVNYFVELDQELWRLDQDKIRGWNRGCYAQ